MTSGVARTSSLDKTLDWSRVTRPRCTIYMLIAYTYSLRKPWPVWSINFETVRFPDGLVENNLMLQYFLYKIIRQIYDKKIPDWSEV